MPASLEAALEKAFSDNINHEINEPQHYSIRVAGNDPETKLAVVDFRFLSGERYCCFEFGCHCGLISERGWAELRGLLPDPEMDLPPGTVLRFEVTVEAGAIFCSSKRMWGSGPSAGYSYSAELVAP